MKELLSYWW